MSVLPTPDLPADWVGKLPDTFAKNGFEVVASDRVSLRDPYRMPWAQSALVGIEETSAKGGEEEAKQAQGLIDSLLKEIAQGAVMEAPCICVVGRKRPI
ncbi:MAG: hypothetical protein Q9159_005283 [Coniocarpon cinnabarinum]